MSDIVTEADADTPSHVYLRELKAKSPTELLAYAESLEVENASSLRTQDMLYAILRDLAERDIVIIGRGVLEVLSDGFGFLRSPESNYLAGPDDIYVNPKLLSRPASRPVIRLMAPSTSRAKASGILR